MNARKIYGLPTFDCWPNEQPIPAQGPYSYVCIVDGPVTVDTRAEDECDIAWLPAADWIDAMEERGDWSRPGRAKR